jgi:hypothetical protein
MTNDFILTILAIGLIALFIIFRIFIQNSKPKTNINYNTIDKPSQKPIVNDIKTDYESNNLIYLKNNWIEQIRKQVFDHDSIIDLLKFSENEKINYSNLLDCFEWQFKRFKILYRDKFKCTDCSELSTKLHVHHLYYVKNEMPWEIEDNGLVSLCRNCHTKRHEKDNIHIYINKSGKLERNNESILKCVRCMGTGYLPQFSHVENGICFLCKGSVINKSVFIQRLSEIRKNPYLYNFNGIYDEFNCFISSITSEYYYNNIHGKLYDEITDFFSSEGSIIYKTKKRKQIEFFNNQIMKNRDINDDDLPF